MTTRGFRGRGLREEGIRRSNRRTPIVSVFALYFPPRQSLSLGRSARSDVETRFVEELHAAIMRDRIWTLSKIILIPIAGDDYGHKRVGHIHLGIMIRAADQQPPNRGDIIHALGLSWRIWSIIPSESRAWRSSETRQARRV